jgi:hypothetical protein
VKARDRNGVRGGFRAKEMVMSTREKERLMFSLFERENITLVNLKFFRGDRDVVSEEELCKQMHSAFLQKRMGRATVSHRFEEDTEKVDIRRLVETF